MTQRLRDGAQHFLQRQALEGGAVLRVVPDVGFGRLGVLIETALAASSNRGAPAAIDLLLGQRLQGSHSRAAPQSLNPAPLLTFDDASARLEGLLEVLEGKGAAGVALVRPEALEAGLGGGEVSRHMLRWALGAGLVVGLWVSQDAQNGAASALHRAVHVGASRLRRVLGLDTLWIGTDARRASAWLKTFAAQVGARHILTAQPGLWPLASEAQEVCRLTVDAQTSPAALYDFLCSSPTERARSVAWQRLMSLKGLT